MNESKFFHTARLGLSITNIVGLFKYKPPPEFVLPSYEVSPEVVAMLEQRPEQVPALPAVEEIKGIAMPKRGTGCITCRDYLSTTSAALNKGLRLAMEHGITYPEVQQQIALANSETLKAETELEAALSPQPLSVSDSETWNYQTDLLLDDLQHLETEHLPAKGRIAGKPCDCISKAARDARRHARETIPIAARQGKDTEMLTRIETWANNLVTIGTLKATSSGVHDEQYLKEAGEASKFRKELEKLR